MESMFSLPAGGPDAAGPDAAADGGLSFDWHTVCSFSVNKAEDSAIWRH